jgi:hypothetical protein
MRTLDIAAGINLLRVTSPAKIQPRSTTTTARVPVAGLTGAYSIPLMFMLFLLFAESGSEWCHALADGAIL